MMSYASKPKSAWVGRVMTKRTEDGGRARVIATARRLFQQKGFHQTAMAELSESSGVSVGQIYRLFANKSEMIAAIVEEDTETQLSRFAEIRDAVAAGKQTLRDGFKEAVLDALDQSEEALMFEILAEGFRNPQVGDLIGHHCERYRTMLKTMILMVDPSLSGERLAAVAEMLLAILFGHGGRRISNPELGPDETASHAADMILAMITDYGATGSGGVEDDPPAR